MRSRPVFLMLAAASATFAQTPAQTPQNLTLAQAVQIAIKNHPKIAAAQNLQSAEGQQVIEARAPYYPNVSAEVTGSQGLYESRIGAGALAASQLFNRQGEGLIVNQLITDLGRTGNLVASSKLQAQAAAQSTRQRFTT